MERGEGVSVDHEDKRRIQDGECVCDTLRGKVLLEDVKLCPTWKVNEVKCPDFALRDCCRVTEVVA